MTGSDPTNLEAIARRVCEMAGDIEAQALVTRHRYGLTRFANSFIHQHHGEDTTKVAVKVAVEGRVASASTTDDSDDGLSRLVDDATTAALLQPVDVHWPGVAEPADTPDFEKTSAATIGAQPSDRADGVAAFIDAGTDLSAAGYLDTSFQESAVATTAGQSASGGATRAIIDGIHRGATSAGNGHQTSVDFSQLDAAAAGRRAADLARRGTDPIDLQPGEYPVVLSPECVATIAIFLAGYGFGGQSYVDGQSFVELGERQFDESFHLIDDPLDSRVVSLPFDADGTPKRTLPLVEAGVSKAIAHDRRTALRAGAESTGHAIPVSYFGPFPTSVVVGAGTSSAQDLIGDVERGVYVSTFNYCRILDPRSQVVTGLTRNGTFLVESGEITRPLSNLRFTQSFLNALGEGSILGIGNDQRYADSEFGPGLVIAPSMSLAAWRFTGGAQG
ncbi:MAG TPA: metallopeptidase TldD-related protein [Acidimicrobiia bacterium]